MIVQCEACQTRFRLADDKIKPGGTKVRCSKCKEVFTVLPSAIEPEEETVDFGSFNMEKVAEGTPDAPDDGDGEETSAPDEEAGEQPQTDDLDFSTLEQGLTGNNADELADDFTFAETGQPAVAASEGVTEDTTDLAAAFDETDEATGPAEFAFNDTEDDEQPEFASRDFAADDTGSFDSGAFTFDKADPTDSEATDEFTFGDEEQSDTFSVGETTATEGTEEQGSDFSINGDDPFGETAAEEWGETTPVDNTSFDFDEPSFDSAQTAASKPEKEGLQFGEIDFADEVESGTPRFSSQDDFSQATLQPKLETEERPSAPSRREPPPMRELEDREPLPALPKTSKGPLSKVLALLVLLLLAIGGAAGYLYLEEGSLSLNTLSRYLPFLKGYVSEAPVAEVGHKIGLQISGSAYVNNKAGQLLVIQGAAVNNYKTTRSAITIKGVLLGANGQTLLQQTAFCGNPLSEEALSTMTYSAIEEAMNNQFGDSLSNMNVAAGASIPFTIVFRNLPAGIANINVEVADSKPGAR